MPANPPLRWISDDYRTRKLVTASDEIVAEITRGWSSREWTYGGSRFLTEAAAKKVDIGKIEGTRLSDHSPMAQAAIIKALAQSGFDVPNGEPLSYFDDVKGKTVLMVDDMITTAGTVAEGSDVATSEIAAWTCSPLAMRGVS